MAQFIIETSARHAHVTQETLEVLFGKGFQLEVKKMLSQPGQFASNQRIRVVGPKGEVTCTILGPVRKADQVELSFTDARTVGVVAPVRESGDVAGSAACKLVGPCGEIELKEGVIVAKRHIHMTPREASLAHVKDNDEVFVITQSFERGLIFADVVVRVSPKFKLAMHVDTDEANAFGSDSAPTGAILKLFDGQTYSLQQWADEVASGINR